ncbi:hypothetical protein [Otoolea muris]|uniref:hypothetical protein n=1 Tax=Otoolea muris TaxID=2941515 RepID=UPI00203B31C1|nr:hypothetical protein [Otoolea muris]
MQTQSFVADFTEMPALKEAQRGAFISHFQRSILISLLSHAMLTQEQYGACLGELSRRERGGL